MRSTSSTIIDELLSLQDLSPGVQVNRVMSQLVEIAISQKDTVLIKDDTIVSRIREISNQAESEMEKYWARKIIASLMPSKTLDTFPYKNNYTELTRRELALTIKSGLNITEDHRALVIGSGPLPLSAYELHMQSGATVDHVDSSPDAIDLCRQVSSVLSIDANYYEAYGESVVLDTRYDLVIVAALAGDTAREKSKIITNILPYLANDGRIIIRSAYGNRTLLYPGINPAHITGLTLVEEYHPTDHIINSILVYKNNTRVKKFVN